MGGQIASGMPFIIPVVYIIHIYNIIYVGRRVWISANHGSVLCVTIHGLCVYKGAKYKFADNPWITLHAQTLIA